MSRGEPDAHGIAGHFDGGVQHLRASRTQPDVCGLRLGLARPVSKVEIETESRALAGVNQRGAEAISAMMLHDLNLGRT